MNAQKREVEIRRCVHVTAYQVGAPGAQLGIISTEWNDAHVARQGARQPIGVETGTIEHDTGFPRSVRCEHPGWMRPARLDDPPHGNAELHPRAGRSGVLRSEEHTSELQS